MLKGRGLFRGAFGCLNRPLHFEWSCANLAWLLVAIGVIFRVWEYLEFRILYMDEDCFAEKHRRPGDLRIPAGARRRPDGSRLVSW